MEQDYYKLGGMKLKSRKKLKITLMIFICILISLVGFVGIYSKNGNQYSNIIPDYKFASDLKGSTVLELEVDTSTNTVYYDAEGKKVETSEITDENKNQYTSKEEKVNEDENLTEENYENTLKILEERLKFLQADQYSLDLDKKTGKIVLTFEDEYPDDVKSILPMEGKLELIDSKTADILLNYSDIKSAEATYASTENGYTIYLNLKLNENGLEKIKNIEGYKVSTDDNGEVTTSNFSVRFDEEELEEVSYNDMVLTGKTLRIALASNITSSSTVNSKLNTATVVSKLTTMGKTPVVYKITAEEYIKTAIQAENIVAITITLEVVLAIIFVYLIIRFKLNGILAVIATLANTAIFTILIRLTNISISLNAFAGIVALIIMNTYLIINLLKAMKNEEKTVGENIKEAYLKTMDVLIIGLIIFAVFAFSKMTVISSMGLLLFWGWLVVVLGNLLLTVPMLKLGGKK